MAVGERLLLDQEWQKEKFLNARKNLRPMRFSMVKVPHVGWRLERLA
jgi:hypothetical protein